MLLLLVHEWISGNVLTTDGCEKVEGAILSQLLYSDVIFQSPKIGKLI